MLEQQKWPFQHTIGVCQVFCVSFYFQVADYYSVSHFFRLNNSHISGFVPVTCHPWKAGCGQVPSLIQGGCSIFYTVPQRTGKALSLQRLSQGMSLSLWLLGNWNSPPLWRWSCTLFSTLHSHNYITVPHAASYAPRHQLPLGTGFMPAWNAQIQPPLPSCGQ